MDKQFWDTRETAKFIGIQPGTLEIWRVQGKGPRFVKFGRAVRYSRGDVLTWVDAQVRHSTSEEVSR